jgi:hypothetical protein
MAGPFDQRRITMGTSLKTVSKLDQAKESELTTTYAIRLPVE